MRSLILPAASSTKEVTTFRAKPSWDAMTTKSLEMFSQRSVSSMTKEMKMLPIPAVKIATAMLLVAMTIVTVMLQIPTVKLGTVMIPVAMTIAILVFPAVKIVT